VFSFFKKNNQQKLKQSAEDWIRLAHKIYHFRRDLLSDKDLRELSDASSKLSVALKDAVKNKQEGDWGKVRMCSENMENILKQVGGFFYPRSSWAENTEMLLVAAIVALAIRTFFLQPFKIPTNSMYPTYNGMTAEVFTEETAPNGPERIFRTLAYGAFRKDLVAENSGEVLIPVDWAHMSPYHEGVIGKKWFILKTPKYLYTIRVGNKDYQVEVPADFAQEMQKVIFDTYFAESSGEQDWTSFWLKKRQEYRNQQKPVVFLKTGKMVQPGDHLLDFDIMTGDALFVDRFTYHFAEPDVGDPIVFRTDNIPTIVDRHGNQENKYYIKRLVGKEEDVLKIQDPVLFRNGLPITGAEAFELNANEVGEYRGYIGDTYSRNMRYLKHGATFTVPEDSYFAMGDNSAISSDSRYWGSFKNTEIVGRAFFIYHPFTKRWGLAE